MDKQPLEELLQNDYKQYVDVIEMRYADGSLAPLSFVWDDGHVYHISKVVDAKPAASLKAGGCGLRYTVEVINNENGRSKQVFMFLEEDRWFIERKIPRRLGD